MVSRHLSVPMREYITDLSTCMPTLRVTVRQLRLHRAQILGLRHLPESPSAGQGVRSTYALHEELHADVDQPSLALRSLLAQFRETDRQSLLA